MKSHWFFTTLGLDFMHRNCSNCKTKCQWWYKGSKDNKLLSNVMTSFFDFLNETISIWTSVHGMDQKLKDKSVRLLKLWQSMLWSKEIDVIQELCKRYSGSHMKRLDFYHIICNRFGRKTIDSPFLKLIHFAILQLFIFWPHTYLQKHHMNPL